MQGKVFKPYLPLDGVMTLFPVVVAQDPLLFASLNLIGKGAAVLPVKQRFYNFQPFAIMVCDILQCTQVDHMFL